MSHFLVKQVYRCVIGLMLISCGASQGSPSSHWQIYHNPRFGFEFPYPSDWKAAAPPSNADGQEFQAPNHPTIEMRGWASYQLPEGKVQGHDPSLKVAMPSWRRNFTTQQGYLGELKVEIGLDISSMTLTLMEGEVQYNWQGKAPQEEFDDYYKFFYYVVSQYRIEQPTKHQ